MKGNPMQDRCGAHCRTTGHPCLNFPMINGRCRMHGGKSTGRPTKHGFYTQSAMADRLQMSQLTREVNELASSLSAEHGLMQPGKRYALVTGCGERIGSDIACRQTPTGKRIMPNE